MITLLCSYREHATVHVSSNWTTICQHHETELPDIRVFEPGSFNLTLRKPLTYVPPCDREFKAAARGRGQDGGNHISPLAKVICLNGNSVEAWLYRGGHPNNSLELFSKIRLKEFLRVSAGAEVIVIIEEKAINLCGQG